MARRTKEEALETRNCLLDTATKLFCDKGVATTTLTDIANEAGVSRGAVYWHFKNKADLFEALWGRLREPLDVLAEISENPNQPYPLDRLRDFLVAILHTVATRPEHQHIFRLLIKRSELDGELCEIGEKLREAHRAFRDRIERILGNACRRGQLPDDYPLALAAFMVQSSLDGVVLNWLEDASCLDLAAEAPRIVDALMSISRDRSLPEMQTTA